MSERNEILVADDEEEIRRGVVEAVREVFPDFEIIEAINTRGALNVLDEVSERIFLVVSDGSMGGNVNAGALVTKTARKKGVPHVAYYSSSA